MSEKKAGPRPVDTDGAGADTSRFDLVDLFAIPVVEPPLDHTTLNPFPVTFLGTDYDIKRAHSGADVMAFFKTLRKMKSDDSQTELLGHMLTHGDAAKLWSEVSELSNIEYEHLMTWLYKIAGLMSAEGKFLRS